MLLKDESIFNYGEESSVEQSNEDKLAAMVYLLAYFALPVCLKSLGSGKRKWRLLV